MRVNIGPYRTWWGPYQLADLLQRVGVNEDRCHLIGEWLADTWVSDLCQWVDSKKKRKVDIRIDNYDIWSMEHTLSLIALPMLKLLKEKKHGSPFVDDEDVPEHLRSSAAPPKENEWDTDELFHDRFSWVLDEMIWAHEQVLNDDEHSEYYDPYEDGEDVVSNHTFLSAAEAREMGKFNQDKYKAYNDRLNNGLTLFGKYYRGLWD